MEEEPPRFVQRVAISPLAEAGEHEIGEVEPVVTRRVQVEKANLPGCDDEIGGNAAGGRAPGRIAVEGDNHTPASE
jgi:hypothetical protein